MSKFHNLARSIKDYTGVNSRHWKKKHGYLYIFRKLYFECSSVYLQHTYMYAGRTPDISQNFLEELGVL